MNPITRKPGIEIPSFIFYFFAISDDPKRMYEPWLDCFTEDAEVTMGKKVARGREELQELRRGMWKDVRSRKHHDFSNFYAAASDAFTKFKREQGEDEVEVMFSGKVTLEVVSGEGPETEQKVVDWAAQGTLVRQDWESESGGAEKWKWARYRVWLQS
ncbi:uncharacterized protein QC763_709245 [Podospora pseudopauciseta]|uniref:Uncharacterized protein n=2 Tax=Podospora TaxID=5144 RepID=A0ABR0H230_9PEZI|nr:hypothetical protein QC763_709245 [Podospora pseudopauciseta]KAK4668649.1 hypothetical protein QC764_709245 [Podospora pseudoanserina]